MAPNSVRSYGVTLGYLQILTTIFTEYTIKTNFYISQPFLKPLGMPIFWTQF